MVAYLPNLQLLELAKVSVTKPWKFFECLSRSRHDHKYYFLDIGYEFTARWIKWDMKLVTYYSGREM